MTGARAENRKLACRGEDGAAAGAGLDAGEPKSELGEGSY